MLSSIADKLPTLIASTCFAMGLILASSGCSTLNHSISKVPVDTAEENAPAPALYQVEMSGRFSKGKLFRGEIDGPLTVQDALERSGAIDKFRTMNVMVYRVVEESGRALKMPVDYKPRKKAVSPNQNYALHPNDRIIVQSSKHTALDKLVDSLNPGANYD